jgi:putative heme iron utilization protein
VRHLKNTGVFGETVGKFSGSNQFTASPFSVHSPNGLRHKGKPFWIVAPCATQRTALKKDRRPYSGTIVEGKLLYAEYYSLRH